MSKVEEVSLSRAEELLLKGACVNGVRLRSTRLDTGLDEDSTRVSTVVLVGEVPAAETQGSCPPGEVLKLAEIQRESMLRRAGGLVHPRWQDRPELVLTVRWTCQRELFCDGGDSSLLCVDDESSLQACEGLT